MGGGRGAGIIQISGRHTEENVLSEENGFTLLTFAVSALETRVHFSYLSLVVRHSFIHSSQSHIIMSLMVFNLDKSKGFGNLTITLHSHAYLMALKKCFLGDETAIAC